MIGLFQPEVGRRLAAHPITNQLVMAVNFAKVDVLVGGSVVALIPEDSDLAGPGHYLNASVAYVQGINRYGRWAGFSAPAFSSFFEWTRSDFVPTSTGCTILMLYEKGDASPRISLAFTLNFADGGGVTNRCSAHVPYVDGTVYWDFGGATESTTRLSIAGLTMGADRWVFSTGGRGMEIWQNGIKRASNAANPTRTASGVTPFVLGAKTTDAVFSDIAHYNVFAMWARQLTADEILMVSADPYMLWDAPSLSSVPMRAAAASGGVAITTGSPWLHYAQQRVA